MQLAELTALLIGTVLALSGWLLALTCLGRQGKALTVVRSVLPAVDLGIAALAFTSPATPAIQALGTVAVAFASLALAIELTAKRSEPVWWSSFESSFWRYLEHGSLDEPV